MCGIVGFKNKDLNLQSLKKMASSLRHRGPDAEGFYLQDGIGLGHQRLSIIDPDKRSNQPFRYRNLVLTFNGEIYNYLEIKKELENYGYSFISKSDTEVLICAFHKWREKAVDRFIGMFAFAIYDIETDDLFLFRDRIGVKPLYYYYDNSQFIFGSELKSIKIIISDLSIDYKGLKNYLAFGYFPGKHTIYQNLHKVEPGTYIRITGKGHLSSHTYWDINKLASVPPLSLKEEDLIDQLDELLISSFTYRMVSDVPVGIFLSGGIDSSLLTSVLKKHYGNIQTFTIGFDDSRFDESDYAKKIAKYLNVDHHEYIIKQTQAEDLFKNFYSIYDEPFFDTSGIPTALISQYAHDQGIKVVLSADGGDELFAGYKTYLRSASLYSKISSMPYFMRNNFAELLNRFNGLSSIYNLQPYNIGHRLSKLQNILEAKDILDVYKSLISSLSSHHLENTFEYKVLSNTLPTSDKFHDMQRLMAWDLKHSLPDDLLLKVDRATMYNSVEAREPFLDHRLIEFSFQIPLQYKVKNGEGKYILKKLLRRYLPETYFDRPKQGFQIPLYNWLQNATKNWDTLSDIKDLNKFFPGLDKKELERELNLFRYFSGPSKENNLLHIYKLYSLHQWAAKEL